MKLFGAYVGALGGTTDVFKSKKASAPFPESALSRTALPAPECLQHQWSTNGYIET